MSHLSSHIGPDELAYLKNKGALTIPHTSLRNELAKAYIEFVYPYLPSIDLCDFLVVLNGHEMALSSMSLILFQAIMFAGAAFVDMSHLNSAGYLTRKAAQKELFQKVRLLYTLDCEPDRISLIQALLTLTFYYETPDDQKDTWYWMGVVASEAYALGLHLVPEKSATKDFKLRKRIWWSVYMRDRMIGLGMRRPFQISEDYNVPMLTVDDFEVAEIPQRITCVAADCAVARDPVVQRRLATMCIAKVNLCLCVGRILSKHYLILQRNQGVATDRTSSLLVPKELHWETSDIRHWDGELNQWRKNLPENLLRQESLTEHRSINLHRSLLHMIFFAALSTLHRPWAMSQTPPRPLASPAALLQTEQSREIVRQAATAITTIVKSLDDADLVQYLPLTGVTVLLPALTAHLVDLKAAEESIRVAASSGFFQCIQALNKLRDLYFAADYSIALIEQAAYATGNDTARIHVGFDLVSRELTSSDMETESEAATTMVSSANKTSTVHVTLPATDNVPPVNEAGYFP
ncbi:fungal-specific transcription factor domain-containing protein [Ilyonectria robusta]|uniref:fungal-specific transcription factor domain-containing protein n=1 Tax=Ilyonectria robusta TaxID=1079257 RepID=UPI001E8D0A9A|nr:fungal-specific transcription factor domain-containing protein [Ilyonectria robusta]XP_046094808.1 fungal-specific transcription factor domain-containing protein [Ilyonectria robusta]KAH8647523.1 fungal-specific transcription factor domain-containing protein [Ilyonectria robusta]KAH8656350.1 fungal-specific transcription factor domain-containing protein [Ilyonectria robusta]